MAPPTPSTGAPGILPDACLLIDDLIDQLIDGGNAVAERNATKHYWQRSQTEARTSHQTTSFLGDSTAVQRSSVSFASGDEETITESSKTTTLSSSGDTDSRFIIDMKDFDSAFVIGEESSNWTMKAAGSNAIETPSKDTYRTLCSRIEGDETSSGRPESLYRSSTTTSYSLQPPVAVLADSLGYKIPAQSSTTAATSTITPDYRSEPIWREKKRELMRAMKHRH